MKQRYLIAITFLSMLFLSNALFAQQYRWLKGGGSTDNLNNGAIKGEWVTHMCTDDKGNVYSLAKVGDYNIKADTFILSQSSNANSQSTWNILFIKHDCNGNMKFAKLIESNSTNHTNGLVYSAGKVYVAGTLYNNGKRIGYDATFSSVYQSSFLSKFDTSGGYEWTSFIGPDSFSTYIGSGAIQAGLDVDGQGNIHYFTGLQSGVRVTPSVISQHGNYDISFAPNGILLNARKLQGIDSNYFVKQVVIDKSNGRYYALFEYAGGTIVRSNMILAEFNADGTLSWKDTVNARGGINAFRYIPNDGIYIAAQGYTQYGGLQIGGLTVTGTDYAVGPIAAIGKINHSNGNSKWLYQMGCSNSILGFTDITVLPDKSISAAGIIGGTVVYNNVYKDTIKVTPNEGHNPFYVNIDSTGLLIDWHQMHGSQPNEMSKAMTSDKVGNVYLGGELISDMQAGNLPKYISNGGNSDYYISKYGYDCNCTTPAFPTADFTYAIDTANKQVQFTFTGANPADSIFWWSGDGKMSKQNSFSNTYADTGIYTVCVKVHVPCGRKKICKQIRIPGPLSVSSIAGMPNVKIYPNPANDMLYIDGVEVGAKIDLYDMMGRKSHSSISTSQPTSLNISSLPTGNYIIQITQNDGQRMTGKVVKR